MNTDTIKGKWRQIKGELQKTWGKITDDEWESTRGETTAVSGLVQSKYGHTKDEVNRKINELYDRHTSGLDSEPSSNLKADSVESSQEDSNFVNQLRRDQKPIEKRSTEF